MRRYSGDLKREGRDSVGDGGSSMEDYVTEDQRGDVNRRFKMWDVFGERWRYMEMRWRYSS